MRVMFLGLLLPLAATVIGCSEPPPPPPPTPYEAAIKNNHLALDLAAKKQQIKDEAADRELARHLKVVEKQMEVIRAVESQKQAQMLIEQQQRINQQRAVTGATGSISSAAPMVASSDQPESVHRMTVPPIPIPSTTESTPAVENVPPRRYVPRRSLDEIIAEQTARTRSRPRRWADRHPIWAATIDIDRGAGIGAAIDGRRGAIAGAVVAADGRWGTGRVLRPSRR